MPPPRKILPYAALCDPNPVVSFVYNAGSPTLGAVPNQYHDSISNVITKVHRSLPFLVWVSRAYVTCWEVSTNAIGQIALKPSKATESVALSYLANGKHMFAAASWLHVLGMRSRKKQHPLPWLKFTASHESRVLSPSSDDQLRITETDILVTTRAFTPDLFYANVPPHALAYPESYVELHRRKRRRFTTPSSCTFHPRRLSSYTGLHGLPQTMSKFLRTSQAIVPVRAAASWVTHP
ncbi:uncharacterized protein ARMOST_01182 [Armillaria ostoyae]|uniref:Uncharacterized protein n=1 Tax=Armillaria ostoyae TaxID=47428 RepID=A0A284QN92_ARMOS|nr:uncharacterized protein ARMOST_01182 [Armillaria ostoyae]